MKSTATNDTVTILEPTISEDLVLTAEVGRMEQWGHLSGNATYQELRGVACILHA
jgi:hypothetical protein